jgi:HSP20 family molecular chaperone IbpA
MSFEEFFELFSHDNEFIKNLWKIMTEIGEAEKNGVLKGKWESKVVGKRGAKDYSIREYFKSNQPFEPIPFNPFEPPSPIRRRPTPKRPFEGLTIVLKEANEPLVDFFEDEKKVTIYFEIRGVNNNELQLNVTAEKVEVKAKNFYKLVNLPSNNFDLEKATSRCKNSVLEVIIPKKKHVEGVPHKININ